MPKMTENANECSEPLQRVQVVSSVSMDAVETMPQDREEQLVRYRLSFLRANLII